MINLHEHPNFDAYWMLQVYDEMNISCPVDKAVEQMYVLQEAMESIPLSTSLPTDGEWGWNWGSMNKLKDIEELRDVIPF